MSMGITSVLEASLDAVALRQRVIANNIANVNTPGFKASRVNFEDELRNYLTGGRMELIATHPNHLGNTSPSLTPVVTKSEQSMRPDGNSVDIDSEQVLLADNVIRFQALSMQMDEQLARMRLVVTEGRG